ncbi:hypothetical protein EZS27_010890 [termite gut metagenome]|uniref:Uncharacterized protein n=1 Tax=termite gut metagenome TaxID=433724 RepID=A0A5J4S7F7_9ZZZZ
MDAIYKVDIEGYYSRLTGIFVETKEFVEMSSELVFIESEMTGKYQEVTVRIERDVVLVTDDPTAVNIFQTYDMKVGYNPFDTIRNYLYDETFCEKDGKFVEYVHE